LLLLIIQAFQSYTDDNSLLGDIDNSYICLLPFIRLAQLPAISPPPISSASFCRFKQTSHKTHNVRLDHEHQPLFMWSLNPNPRVLNEDRVLVHL